MCHDHDHRPEAWVQVYVLFLAGEAVVGEGVAGEVTSRPREKQPPMVRIVTCDSG